MDRHIGKSEDCIKCICTTCNQHNKTDIEKCKHSDCKWCLDEIGEYSEYCRHYDIKGEEQ